MKLIKPVTQELHEAIRNLTDMWRNDEVSTEARDALVSQWMSLAADEMEIESVEDALRGLQNDT